jgi:hypothetical protein
MERRSVMTKQRTSFVWGFLFFATVVLGFSSVVMGGPVEDGKVMLEKFQFDSAAEAFKKAIQSDPLNEELWRLYDYAKCEACKAQVSGCESMTQEKLTITNQTLPDGIKIKDMQILTSPSSKYLIIKGKISSNAVSPINTLKITLNFIDANGMVTAGAHFYIYGLLPKEEKTVFAAILKASGIKSVEALGEIEK